MKSLSVHEQIVIAGIEILGKSHTTDGYVLTHPNVDTKAIKEESLYKMSSRWYNRSEAKQFRREVSSRIGTIQYEDGECAMTDTEIMAELTKAARHETDFTKKSQILMRVSEMKARLATENANQEDRRVVMYLPFSCDCRQCSLFHAERERIKENNKNEDYEKE